MTLPAIREARDQPRLQENERKNVWQRRLGQCFEPFHDLFPEVAERESRTVRLEIGRPGGVDFLAGDYLFFESYCTDPDCDCERVLLSVIEKTRGIVATISYGFDGAELIRWMTIREKSISRPD